MSSYNSFEDLLRLCGAKIDEELVQQKWSRTPYNKKTIDRSVPLKIPQGMYYKIVSTSTKGTIGRLIGIEIHSIYRGTYILEIDGRPKPSKINPYYTEYLENYSGPTIWVRNIVTHDKKPSIKNPVNKYNQMLQKDDWVIGLTGHGTWKQLSFGQITRWTNHNVWMKPVDVVGKKSQNEVKLCNIKETFIMPNEDFMGSLMWAALGGKYRTSNENN